MKHWSPSTESRGPKLASLSRGGSLRPCATQRDSKGEAKMTQPQAHRTCFMLKIHPAVPRSQLDSPARAVGLPRQAAYDGGGAAEAYGSSSLSVIRVVSGAKPCQPKAAPSVLRAACLNQRFREGIPRLTATNQRDSRACPSETVVCLGPIHQSVAVARFLESSRFAGHTASSSDIDYREFAARRPSRWGTRTQIGIVYSHFSLRYPGPCGALRSESDRVFWIGQTSARSA